MLLIYLITLALLASPIVSAPTTLSPTATPVSESGDLDTSETGHFRRKRIWKKLAKQLSGLGGSGLGGYGLGSFGLGGFGVDLLLTELGNIHKHQHSHHNHHSSHGGYGAYPAGHHGPSYVGASYGGYAPSYSYPALAGPSLGFGHGATLGHFHGTSLPGPYPDLGLWDASLGVHHGYGWGSHGGLDFGDFWI